MRVPRRLARPGAARHPLAAALFASCAAHALVLALWFLGDGAARGSSPDDSSLFVCALLGIHQARVDPLDEAHLIDLMPEMAFVTEAELAPAPTREGRDDFHAARESAPRRADGSDPRAPAPDEGAGAGRQPRDAWRRDRGELSAALTDGSDRNRPSRIETGRAARSPQAIRQEPRTGEGDGVVPAEREQRILTVAPYVDADDASDVVRTTSEQAAALFREGDARMTVTGPLDATPGERRFDVEDIGPARDVIDSPSASSERRPGPVDFSHASALGAGDTNRGPAPRPGAVARPTRGRAAAVEGALAEVEEGADVSVSAQGRERYLYEREIRRRAADVLRFPRNLALALEQGETIVRFVVGADGRIYGGVAVVKSAGFREFDQEAVRAVRVAAPYPRMRGALTVMMRFPFANPLVR
jgi:TonB family protein